MTDRNVNPGGIMSLTEHDLAKAHASAAGPVEMQVEAQIADGMAEMRRKLQEIAEEDHVKGVGYFRVRKKGKR
jgi:hypothetical protein